MSCNNLGRLPEDRLEELKQKLLERYNGDRYEAVVAIDLESGCGKIDCAIVHVIDFHDPKRVSMGSNRSRILFQPIFSGYLVYRTDDGSPSYREAIDKATKFLDCYDPKWKEQQAEYGHLCLELAYVPMKDMRYYFHPALIF